MNKLVSIGEASKALGVSIQTLRRWEAAGRLLPEHTVGGHRRYNLARLRPDLSRLSPDDRGTLAYARVSSHEQREALARQRQILERYCVQQGWTFEILSDQGSGVDYYKKGLKKLLDSILSEQVGRLVITRKDRLLRLGVELVFAVCEAKQVEVVILNQDENMTFEEDLTPDLLEIIAVFRSHLHDDHSGKNWQLLERVDEAIRQVNSQIAG